MSANRLVFVLSIVVVTLVGCSASKTSYLKDVGLNYEYQGFLTTDIFQVHCYSDLKPGFNREKLLKQCRQKAAIRLAEYRVKYALYEYNKVNIPAYGTTNPDPAQLSFYFNKGQKQAIEKFYARYFPGYIVAEYRSRNRVKVVYRLEYENLIEDVQEKSFPYSIRLDKIELFQ